MSRSVYFVGTVGLDTARDVFNEVGQRLSGHLRQIPDGEVAGRRQWVTYQLPVLRSYRFLKPVPPGRFVPLELSDDFDPAEVRFAELGYAREARTSYVDFIAARDRGLLESSVRFQVGMPTPFAVLRTFLTPPAVAAVEQAYTEAMLREVSEIARHIPHQDLAFQWDVAPEMIEWDCGGNAGGLLGADGHQGILDRMRRLSEAVPADVRKRRRGTSDRTGSARSTTSNGSKCTRERREKSSRADRRRCTVSPSDINFESDLEVAGVTASPWCAAGQCSIFRQAS